MGVMKLGKKTILSGLFFFILAFILRIARIGDLSYFSGDEEIIGFILRRMAVDKIPVLTSPSATLGLSLGSFFHWLILPFYVLFGNQYQPLFYLAALLGAFSSMALYFVAGSFWSRKVGFIASVFYSCSFLIVLFDMRLWVHSINPLLTILNLWGLNQMARGKYSYSILVAISVIFGWHSDPAILALGLATLLVFIIFKLPLWKKEHRLGYLIVAISILPLLFFDLRHNFINLTRMTQLARRPFEAEQKIREPVFSTFRILGTGLGKFFYISPSKRVSLNFCYCDVSNSLNRGNMTGFGLFLFVMAFYLVYCKKHEKQADFILLIQFIAIIGGLVLYSLLFGGSVFQFYLTGIFPLVAIMAAVGLSRLPNILSGLLIAVWLIINLSSYVNSDSMGGMKYKNEIVRWIKNEIKDGQYVLQAKGTGALEGGGWTYLLTESGVGPGTSYIDPVIGWLYENKRSVLLVPEIRDTILLTNAGTSIDDLVFDKEFTSGAFKVYLIRK